jgi:hypothetical protein
VRIYLRGELIKTHERTPSGGRATDYADYPDGRAPHALRWPNYYRKRARELAPAVRGNMYADCGREAPMPYTSGETPEVGDYVKK